MNDIFCKIDFSEFLVFPDVIEKNTSNRRTKPLAEDVRNVFSHAWSATLGQPRSVSHAWSATLGTGRFLTVQAVILITVIQYFKKKPDSTSNYLVLWMITSKALKQLTRIRIN